MDARVCLFVCLFVCLEVFGPTNPVYVLRTTSKSEVELERIFAFSVYLRLEYFND